jgi:hypothetical protein
MSRIMTEHLMRQQSNSITHESYWVELLGGGGGLIHSQFLQTPPPIAAPEIFSKKHPP